MNMVKTTRRAMLAGIIGLASVSSALAQGININGIYDAQGRNPDGSVYTGTAIVAELNNAVQVSWTVGVQNYTGTGVRDGQVVVVNWGQPAPVVYVVMPNGELHGTWASGTALERLVRR